MTNSIKRVVAFSAIIALFAMPVAAFADTDSVPPITVDGQSGGVSDQNGNATTPPSTVDGGNGGVTTPGTTDGQDGGVSDQNGNSTTPPPTVDGGNGGVVSSTTPPGTTDGNNAGISDQNGNSMTPPPTTDGGNGGSTSTPATTTDTTTTDNTSSGGGAAYVASIGGGYFSGGGGFLSSTSTNILSTTGSSTSPLSCPFMTDYVLSGSTNQTEITKLQTFLKAFGGSPSLVVTGVFDAQTIAAVKLFQANNLSDIMGPWGSNTPSGQVYITTLKEINKITCNIHRNLTPAEQAIIDAYKNSITSGSQSNTVQNPTTNVSVPAFVPASSSVIGDTETVNNAPLTADVTTSGLGSLGHFFGNFFGSIAHFFSRK